MQFDFIHAGLGKCMSTTLQNLWKEAPNTHYKSGAPVANVANQLVQQHRHNPSAIPLFTITPEEVPQSISVLSSESFTFSFLNEPHNAALIGPKQSYVAKGLQALSSTVLFVVRDPVAWIRSCHSQSIHQGGHQNAAEFLSAQREILTENLKLDRLFATWKQHGFRIVVLPMELFIQDSPSFWLTYENLLGTSRPDCQSALSVRQRNQSRRETLPLAAEINRLLHALADIVKRGDSPDRSAVGDALETVRLWGPRRAFETANAQEILDLKQRIAHQPEDEFHDCTFDDELLSTLRAHYVQPLRSFAPMNGWVDAYAASLGDS